MIPAPLLRGRPQNLKLLWWLRSCNSSRCDWRDVTCAICEVCACLNCNTLASRAEREDSPEEILADVLDPTSESLQVSAVSFFQTRASIFFFVGRARRIVFRSGSPITEIGEFGKLGRLDG